MPQLTRTKEPNASAAKALFTCFLACPCVNVLGAVLEHEQHAPVMVALARVFTSSHSEQSR